MIFDGENMFFNGETLSSSLTSNVLNVGGGEAGEPMWVYFQTQGATGGSSLSTVLETAENEAMTSPVTLGTFTGTSFKAKIPRGNKGYLRLKITGDYSGGTVVAGLVLDTDIPWNV